MAEKPILFNTEMVRAILEGRKTQTRRVVKPQPKEGFTAVCYPYSGFYEYRYGAGAYWKNALCAIDDVLWVRETWAEMPYGYVYRADEEEPEGWDPDDRWHPSIHMPKDAARLFLRVTGVRIERLQDISGEDCVAEGCDADMLSEVGEDFIRGVFNGIWDSTIKEKDFPFYSWDANPWVWVISFERIGR